MPRGIYKRTKAPWNKGLPKEQQPWYEKHHSEETKRKMRLARLGKKHSKETKLKMSLTSKTLKTTFKKGNQYGKLNKGRKVSKETRLKMSKAHSREKCYNWKGGITSYTQKLRNSNRWKTWRKRVFKRDNFTCKNCKERGQYIEAHHIVPVKECIQLDNIDLIFDVDNGLSMCYDCHKVKHFGRH